MFAGARIIQTSFAWPHVMATRSSSVSLALLLLPSLLLISFRLVSPEFNEVLSNDLVIELSAHLVTLTLGFFVVIRYRFIADHEYHRSKAVGRLSRIYRLEDKGLWEKGDAAIERLEARAYSDIKGRRAVIAKKRMQSSIGEINRESSEIEQSEENQSSFSIHIDGVEQRPSNEEIEETQSSRKSMPSRISEYLSNVVEKTAIRRVQNSKEPGTKGLPSTEEVKTLPSIGSQWVVPEATSSAVSPIMCQECGIYNDPIANYCSTCGSLIG